MTFPTSEKQNKRKNKQYWSNIGLPVKKLWLHIVLLGLSRFDCTSNEFNKILIFDSVTLAHNAKWSDHFPELVPLFILSTQVCQWDSWCWRLGNNRKRKQPADWHICGEDVHVGAFRKCYWRVSCGSTDIETLCFHSTTMGDQVDDILDFLHCYHKGSVVLMISITYNYSLSLLS